MPTRVSAWSFSLACHQRDVLHDVVVITGAVENQLRHLRLPKLVGRVHHDGILAALRRQIETPRPECEAPEILPELCSRPGLAVIGGNVDRADSIASIPGLATDGDFSGLHLVAT